MQAAKLLALSLLALVPTRAADPAWKPIDIAPVWSAHPVGFDMLNADGKQFVAFYDAERRMTVAARTLPSTEWTFVKLASTLGWDSHNYITMAVDKTGRIHLAGNMHVRPLVYFRTAKPYDISSFEQIPAMVGIDEARCTYPKFFTDPHGDLVFTYRNGSSGNGDQIYNIYEGGKWRRLLDKPLTDGQGRMNAYLDGPTLGPDGYYHLIWVWRNTPDCSTNHDLSYARSRDLVHWETSAGKPLALPIRVETGEVVDPIPPHGGTINGAAHIYFPNGKMVITYFKFDDRGRTQAYAACRERDGWKHYRISDWDYRWDPQGGGTIVFELKIGPLSVQSDGTLRLDYWHAKYGSGAWKLDAKDFHILGELPARQPYPAELNKPESDFPGMQVHLTGKGPYVLRWETLGANRDRPRTGPLPPPSMLRVYAMMKNSHP